jgi:hypothetical protein
MNQTTVNIIHISAIAVLPCTPVPPCLGPLTKINIPIVVKAMVKAMVKAKKSTLTIRPLVSLTWSRWSRWSRQIQHIAHVRARARVYWPFSLTFIFKLIENTLTTLTTSMKSMLFALTTTVTNIDHPDHKGF